MQYITNSNPIREEVIEVDANEFNDLKSRDKWLSWKSMDGSFHCRKCGERVDVKRAPPFPGTTVHCGACECKLTGRTGGGQADYFGWICKDKKPSTVT